MLPRDKNRDVLLHRLKPQAVSDSQQKQPFQQFRALVAMDRAHDPSSPCNPPPTHPPTLSLKPHTLFLHVSGYLSLIHSCSLQSELAAGGWAVNGTRKHAHASATARVR